MARRSVSSRSARQRSNGPSKVQTSGARQVAACGLRRRHRPRHDAAVVRRPQVLVPRAARRIHGAAAGEEAETPAGDLHRDLGRRVGAVIAAAVHLAALAQPVALGEHGDRLGPGRRGSPGRARRRRTTCRAAASCRRRCAPRASPRRAFGQRRASSSSEMPSLGKLGVPVLPASQSMSRQRFASNTCSQAVRAVPLRWLYDRPLRTTAAACGERRCADRRCRAPCRSDGVRAVDPTRSDAADGVDEMRRRDLALAVGRAPRASPSCRRCRGRWRAHGPGPSPRPPCRRPRRRGTSPSRRR